MLPCPSLRAMIDLGGGALGERNQKSRQSVLTSKSRCLPIGRSFSDPGLSAQVGSAGIARLLRTPEHVGPSQQGGGPSPTLEYFLKGISVCSLMPVGAMLQDLSVS